MSAGIIWDQAGVVHKLQTSLPAFCQGPSAKNKTKPGCSSWSEEEQVAANVTTARWITANSRPSCSHHSLIRGRAKKESFTPARTCQSAAHSSSPKTSPAPHADAASLFPPVRRLVGYDGRNRCYIWARRGRKYDARRQSGAVHAAKEAPRAAPSSGSAYNWHYERHVAVYSTRCMKCIELHFAPVSSVCCLCDVRCNACVMRTVPLPLFSKHVLFLFLFCSSFFFTHCSAYRRINLHFRLWESHTAYFQNPSVNRCFVLSNLIYSLSLSLFFHFLCVLFYSLVESYQFNLVEGFHYSSEANVPFYYSTFILQLWLLFRLNLTTQNTIKSNTDTNILAQDKTQATQQKSFNNE